MHYCPLTRKLLLIYAIQSLGGGIAFYIALFLSGHAHLSAAQIGVILSFASIGNIAGGYLGGYLCDKWNASYNLKIGLGIQGGGLFLLIFLQEYHCISVIMMMMGLGSYLYVTSSNYILNSKFNTAQRNRTNIIADQHIISNIGMFFAAILMGYSTEGYYQIIFTGVSLTLLLIALTLKTVKEEDFKTSGNSNTGLPTSSNTNYLSFLGIAVIGIIGLMFAAHRVGFPIFLDINFGNIHTGFLMALNPLIILMCQKTIVRYSTSNEFMAIVIGLVLFAFSFLILNYSPTLLIVLISTSLLTVGEILALTHAQSIAFAYAQPNKRGKIMGLYKATYSFTKVCGTYYAGMIIHNFSYSYLWALSACFGFSERLWP